MSRPLALDPQGKDCGLHVEVGSIGGPFRFAALEVVVYGVPQPAGSKP